MVKIFISNCKGKRKINNTNVVNINYTNNYTNNPDGKITK